MAYQKIYPSTLNFEIELKNSDGSVFDPSSMDEVFVLWNIDGRPFLEQNNGEGGALSVSSVAISGTIPFEALDACKPGKIFADVKLQKTDLSEIITTRIDFKTELQKTNF